MIADPRVEAYLDLLDPGAGTFAEQLRSEAERDGVPVMKRSVERLIRLLFTLHHPKEVLEIGAAVGFSAIVMAELLPADGHVTTMENWAPRIRKAEENLRRAEAGKKITLLTGDAGERLRILPAERFDFIFLDAAKGQYLTWLPDVLRCLKPGGVLLSDDVLQEGSVTESRFAVDRRERTIHARMREYLYTLTHTDGLVTDVLPVGDGAAVTVKRGNDG